MKKILSITNDLEMSKVTSFSAPLLTIGVMYLLSLTILIKSVPVFLFSICTLTLISAVVIICLVKDNENSAEDISYVECKVKNFSCILESLAENCVLSSYFLKAKEDELNYFNLGNLYGINQKCEITLEESFKQIKKINDVNLVEAFKSIDIAKGKKMSYDKENNILYMTLKDFEKLKYSPSTLQRMLSKVTEELIEKENLNEQFLNEAIHLIACDVYVQSI